MNHCTLLATTHDLTTVTIYEPPRLFASETTATIAAI